MQKSMQAYRFAKWGILGVIVVYTGLLVLNLAAASALDILFILTRVLIPASILLAELLVYWLIRKRLYYKTWVRIHILSIWVAMVLLPVTYLVVVYFYRYTGSESLGGYSRRLSMIYGAAFVISLLVGHIFFILSIIKSFSKKKRLQTTVAADSPDILDEFNQQSAV